MSWVLVIYALAALASSVAAALAWAAKLWWSKEFGAAKDEIIRAKEAQIGLLESEIQNLKELTPMKIREYFLSVKVQLEEYNDLLQRQLDEAQSKVNQKDLAISAAATYSQELHTSNNLLSQMQAEKSELESKAAALQEELDKVRAEKGSSERLFELISKGGVFLLPNNMYLSVSSYRPPHQHYVPVQLDPSSSGRKPKLGGGSFAWSAKLPNSISGSNFGERQGKLQVIIYAHITSDKVGPGLTVARWKMPNLQIGPELVEKWTDREIWYYITEEMASQIDDFRQQVLADKEARGFKEVAFAYEPIIETADGQAAGYVPPFQPLPTL